MNFHFSFKIGLCCPWNGFFFKGDRCYYLSKVEESYQFPKAKQKCADMNSKMAFGSSHATWDLLKNFAKQENDWLAIGLEKLVRFINCLYFFPVT